MLKETKIVDRLTKVKTSRRGLLDLDENGNSLPKPSLINKSCDNLAKAFNRPSLFGEQKKVLQPPLRR